jgi:riboflavin-specific deaminase-like protein
LDDDPELTVRHIEGRDPLRIIVDSQLRISPAAKVLRQADRGRTWVLSTSQASADKRRLIEATGASIVDCPAGADGKVDLPRAMKLLAARDITSLFVEGGGTLHAAFIRAGLYDKFIVAIAAKLIGADGRPAIWDLGLDRLEQVPQFVVRRNRRVGKDIWLELEPDVHGNR